MAELGYIIGTAIPLIVVGAPPLWLLPTLLLWLHFGFLYTQCYQVAMINDPRREQESALVRSTRRQWWWMTWGMFACAMGFTAAFALYVFSIELLPIVQTMFSEVLFLWAIFHTINKILIYLKEKASAQTEARVLDIEGRDEEPDWGTLGDPNLM